VTTRSALSVAALASVVAMASVATAGSGPHPRGDQRGDHRPAREKCAVVSVHDGDTVRVRCASGHGREERVRLLNVMAAELDEPGGEAARDALRALLPMDGEVLVERRAHDRYGRTLARVSVNGRLVTQNDVGPRAGRGMRTRVAP